MAINTTFSAVGEQTVAVGQSIAASFLSVLQDLVAWLPNLIGAVIILIIGIYISQLVRRFAVKILKSVRLETVAESLGVSDMLKKAGVAVTVSSIIGGLLYWVVFLVFISAAVTTLGIQALTDFITMLVGYIPSVIAGLIIMLIGLLAAETAARLMDKVEKAKAFKTVVRWLILIITFITAVEQLGFDLSFLTMNLTIVVAGAAFALALAFGLGGQHKAREILEKYLK